MVLMDRVVNELTESSQLTRGSVDSRIASFAATQHGCITTVQLHECGLSKGGISSRVRTGRLNRIHAGVYVMGSPLLTEHQIRMAGTLAVGSDAALGNMTAAIACGWWKRSRPDAVQVVCGRRVNIPGLDVRFSRHWDPARDIQMAGRLRVTSAARTVIDVADGLTRYQLTALVKEAAFWGRWNGAAFELEASRLRGRKGVPTAWRAVESFSAGCAGTRSLLQDRMVRLIDVSGLPRPDEAGYPVGPHEVDLVWPDRGVIVEVDGPGHRQPNSRRRDPARDADLRTAGFEVLRFSNVAIDGDPFTVVAELDRRLG